MEFVEVTSDLHVQTRWKVLASLMRLRSGVLNRTPLDNQYNISLSPNPEAAIQGRCSFLAEAGARTLFPYIDGLAI